MPRIERVLEEPEVVDIQPDRALILVADLAERLAVGHAADVLAHPIDDVLTGAVRQQDDALCLFVELLPLADRQIGQCRRQQAPVLGLGLLRVHCWQRQVKLGDHEVPEDRGLDVAEKAGKVLCIIH